MYKTIPQCDHRKGSAYWNGNADDIGDYNSSKSSCKGVTKERMEANTVMILSFRTNRPWQTVQTQIRLLLEEQSDEGLHCLPFSADLLDKFLYGNTFCLNFRMITVNILVVRKFRTFTVPCGSASTRANIGMEKLSHSLRSNSLVFMSGKPLP